MPQLENLDVDRVDAVDSPANETPFLIAKSVGDLPAFHVDDTDELAANAQQLAEKAQHLVGQLATSGWTAKSANHAKVATDLARLVGFDEVTFVAKSELDADDDLDNDPEDVTAKPTENVGLERALKQFMKLQDRTNRTLAAMPLEICKALAQHVSEQPAPAPRTPARSSQLRGESVTKSVESPKFGEGMFANIVSQPVYNGQEG